MHLRASVNLLDSLSTALIHLNMDTRPVIKFCCADVLLPCTHACAPSVGGYLPDILRTSDHVATVTLSVSPHPTYSRFTGPFVDAMYSAPAKLFVTSLLTVNDSSLVDAGKFVLSISVQSRAYDPQIDELGIEAYRRSYTSVSELIRIALVPPERAGMSVEPIRADTDTITIETIGLDQTSVRLDLKIGNLYEAGIP